MQVMVGEVVVEPAEEEVQGTGETQPLRTRHSGDVALEPLAPVGLERAQERATGPCELDPALAAPTERCRRGLRARDGVGVR